MPKQKLVSGSERLAKGLGLLAFAQMLLIIMMVYGYAATDGWYDLLGFLLAMVALVPFVGFLIWAGSRVRRRASMVTDKIPSYLDIVRRIGWYSMWLALGVVVIGLYAATTTTYGGFIFLAVIVIGTPALLACVFFFAWTSWLYLKHCIRKLAA